MALQAEATILRLGQYMPTTWTEPGAKLWFLFEILYLKSFLDSKTQDSSLKLTQSATKDNLEKVSIVILLVHFLLETGSNS